jgi:hypothetical protein
MKPRLRCAFGALLAAAALAGCAPLAPSAAPSDSLVTRCDRLYATIDAAVARAGVEDGGAARIAGFRYLRVDRFLASFRDAALDETAYRAWVDALAGLDRDARRAELDNLPPDDRAALSARLAADGWPAVSPGALLEGCAQSLGEHDLASAGARARLAAAAQVPDDYDTWKRVVGLYAFTSIPFALGVSRYERGVRATFDAPLERLPVRGSLVRYVPRDGAPLEAREAAGLVGDLPRDRLGLPRPEGRELDRLFAAYAPVLEIDERDGNDRPGYPVPDLRLPRVDTSRPVAFTRLAYARVGDRVLLQLVYSLWFPARPLESPVDLLGGRLDGLTWRVTLAPDGSPIVFDTMHNCGCYHMFFPTPRARLRAHAYSIEETAFVPQRLPTLGPADRVVLRIASGTHYLERVMLAAPEHEGGRAYAFAQDDALRSLRTPEGVQASLFRADGIVPGTERGERWLFWPMGVREPGAMRQWGRHATAFVGRRHFDDPRLLERYFEVDLH